MDQHQELKQHLENFSKTVTALSETKPKSGTPEWLTPDILSAMVMAFQAVMSLLAGLFSRSKGLFDIGSEAMTGLKLLAENQVKQTAILEKILAHLESTCLKKEDAQKMLETLSTSIADNVTAGIPGQIIRAMEGYEIKTEPMKLVRKP
jgi:hypothetical protein